ncbi:hypothetical protein [Leifsonia sp. AG29]|uniref:hypothetical protein n=1 Tax=Leifsonia sp. AG29 TaxID=2598860 RepID=UPI00131B2ADE|nr:hypothetical protein [Leifsonia sp. AG29]
MSKVDGTSFPPGPEYEYGGYHVRIEPDGSTTGRWRVVSDDDDTYFGIIAAAEPVKGEPEVHFATHFPGEEEIPPMRICAQWTSAVEFLLDAGEG